MVRADGVLDKARVLLQQGKAEQSYQLLAPLEDERAGDSEYDYLLGISALDSGKAGLAVFALERAVAVEPNNAEIRAELARAYFEIRDDAAAQREFENVRSSKPPKAVADAVEIANFPEASSAVVEGPYDISLVEGSITTAHDAERIQQIRKDSALLVTIGACATAGGIQALRNALMQPAAGLYLQADLDVMNIPA